MTVYEDSLIEFEKLTHDDKKSELLKLLYKFQKLDNIFVRLINAVSSKNYSDTILLWIYKVVVKSMEKIESDGLESGIDHLKELYTILGKIKKEESADRATEWNPDIRLQQILSTID